MAYGASPFTVDENVRSAWLDERIDQRCIGSRVRTAIDRRITMANRFKVGDHVGWNSEAGRVTDTIIKLHTRDIEYKGHLRHASEDEPQYEIKSDRTEHVAMHKGPALRKIK
jgi:hypothetical protein